MFDDEVFSSLPALQWSPLRPGPKIDAESVRAYREAIAYYGSARRPVFLATYSEDTGGVFRFSVFRSRYDSVWVINNAGQALPAFGCPRFFADGSQPELSANVAVGPFESVIRSWPLCLEFEALVVATASGCIVPAPVEFDFQLGVDPNWLAAVVAWYREALERLNLPYPG